MRPCYREKPLSWLLKKRVHSLYQSVKYRLPQDPIGQYKGSFGLALRSLSAADIEEFIADDKIVWAACRAPRLDLTQGKFVRGRSPLEPYGSEYPYSFCVFKRGVTTGFLAAHHWLVDDADDDRHGEAIQETLAKMFSSK